MKKVLIVLFAMASFASFADDGSPQAPQEIIDAAISLCQSYASEDGVAGDELAGYMLNCVNDELAEQGYQALEKIE